jgi:hypothetical protein
MDKKNGDGKGRIDRRRFIQVAGCGAAALLTSNVPDVPPARAATPVIKGGLANTSRAFVADLEIALRATTAEVSLLPGVPTPSGLIGVKCCRAIRRACK